MLVREKVDTGQFEWYRDNKWNLLPSQALCLRRFLSFKDPIFRCQQQDGLSGMGSPAGESGIGLPGESRGISAGRSGIGSFAFGKKEKRRTVL